MRFLVYFCNLRCAVLPATRIQRLAQAVKRDGTSNVWINTLAGMGTKGGHTQNAARDLNTALERMGFA